MSLDELKVGYFYSNGAYGRTWECGSWPISAQMPKPANRFFTSKGLPAPVAAKKGHCSPVEFARWAKYQVALQENDWKRVGGEELTPAESQEA